MRAGTIVAVLVLAVWGVIIADLETHPQGTTAAGNAIVAAEKPGLNALLGQPS